MNAFDCWAASYDSGANPMTILSTRVVRDLLGSTQHARLLDAGCGTGRWGGVGVDSSFEMLRRCKGPVVQGDLHALPIASGWAQVTICTLALTYAAGRKQAWRELARVTEPGGRVIVADLHPQSQDWKRTFVADGVTREIPVEPYSEAEWLGDAGAAGLQLLHRVDARFGDAERPAFAAAGRLDRFEAAGRQLALLATVWIRP